jgi:AraC family transcriptional regulator
MKNFKVLSNQNKLYSETTSEAFYQNEKSEFSIRFVVSGNEEYFLADKAINIFPGYFLILNDGTIYQRKIFTDIPSNTFSVLFAKKFLTDFHRTITCRDAELLDMPFDINNNCPIFPETLYPFKNDIMYNLLHLKNHFDTGSNNELLINEYLYHSLLLFYQVCHKEIFINRNRLNFVKPCTKKEIFKRLNNVKDYMISNYNQFISIEEMSKFACLSECHLYKLFKELYHCSPHQYLLKIRLNRAKHLLNHTNYPINEIVSMVGFENSSSFIRVFKKNFTVTPKDYRLNKVA